MAYRETATREDSFGAAGQAARTKTVMIVEDNELNMKLFNDLLDAHGYHTLQTRSGKDALSLARQHRPDLILMDIQLPEVSGLDVIRWIKNDQSIHDIPIIAVTAYGKDEDRRRAREAGFDLHLVKPVDPDVLLRKVAGANGC